MSIATQTPDARFAYSPRKEETLLDATKSRDDLGHTSVSSLVTLPEKVADGSRLPEEKIERVPPVYTFDNYMALSSRVAELDEQIVSQTQELMELTEKVNALKDAREDVGLFSAAEHSVPKLEAESKMAEQEAARISEIIFNKQKARDKFYAWQQEVEQDLRQRNEERLQALLDAQAARPPRLGSLDRIDGTIADRTPH